MPKKHRTSLQYTKPKNTPHHSLESSRADDNARFHTAGPARVPQRSVDDASSVNDLINHLRLTQGNVSSDITHSSSSRSFASQRSVPPALREILEIPEPSQPRPRPNAGRTPIGARRQRVAPGPPAPMSWSTGSNASVGRNTDNLKYAVSANQQIYRLDRLPGAAFPKKGSLKDTVLVSMAHKWAWHVQYDGLYLSQLPSNVKAVLLSYLAQFQIEQPLAESTNGLTVLFPLRGDELDLVDIDPFLYASDSDAIGSRLDLGNSLGRWCSFKKLNRIFRGIHSAGDSYENASDELVPDSWDVSEPECDQSHIPRSMGQQLCFDNLKYLSFAHPAPIEADWTELLKLLSHLPKITHLSLAYWPFPKPYTTRHVESCVDTKTTQYHATNILKQLSRKTYCLKWLDVEGCSDWLPLLLWPYLYETDMPDGPEWNGSWRNVVWLNLAPGWRLKVPDGLKDHIPGSTVPAHLITDLHMYQQDIHTYAELLSKARFFLGSLNKKRAKLRGKLAQADTGEEEWEKAEVLLKGMRMPG
ncbi:hypothetical protein N7490_002921 [Penicillium lividum]|nr:hypothetical protein N7490_002921 [Penicillium lividum]